MIKTHTSIGLGTAALGRPHYINIRQEETEALTLEKFRNKGFKTLETAYEQGIRYFDTAPGYGLAEELLIDWVNTKNDPSIEIATKWGYTYTANFDPDATQHEVKEHSLSKLNEQWEQSKKLFPYLKIYQIHSATFESGVLQNQEVLQRLSELKQKYNIMIGITTSGSNQIDVIKKTLDIEIDNQILFDVYQVTYNILDQSIYKIAHLLNKKNIIIKEALANGRLFPNNTFNHYMDLYRVLQELANKYKVGADAIALRFCIDTLSPFKVLSGASNDGHISENLKTETFILEADEIKKLQSFHTTSESYWKERKKLPWN